MEAAAARLAAHQARMAAATAPVGLTRSGNEYSASAVCYGDVLIVAASTGGGDSGSGGESGGRSSASGSGSSASPLALAADPFSGSAGVWSWDARYDDDDSKQQHRPPPAVPAAAAPCGGPLLRGTACTALRVVAISGNGNSSVGGGPLRFGDRFALEVVDPESVWAARGGISGGGSNAGDPSALLLLASRAPSAVLSPSSRAPLARPGAEAGQAVAFVQWRRRQEGVALPRDAAWVALPADRRERPRLDGEVVLAGEPVVLLHGATRRPLLLVWGGGGGAVVAAGWAGTAARTRGMERDGGGLLGPPALPPNVWRFL